MHSPHVRWRQRLTTLPVAGLDLLRLYGSFPSFAPDGESLSYISYPGMSGISAVGLDGAEPRILAKVRHPAFTTQRHDSQFS